MQLALSNESAQGVRSVDICLDFIAVALFLLAWCGRVKHRRARGARAAELARGGVQKTPPGYQSDPICGAHPASRHGARPVRAPTSTRCRLSHTLKAIAKTGSPPSLVPPVNLPHTFALSSLTGRSNHQAVSASGSALRHQTRGTTPKHFVRSTCFACEIYTAT